MLYVKCYPLPDHLTHSQRRSSSFTTISLDQPQFNIFHFIEKRIVLSASWFQRPASIERCAQSGKIFANAPPGVFKLKLSVLLQFPRSYPFATSYRRRDSQRWAGWVRASSFFLVYFSLIAGVSLAIAVMYDLAGTIWQPFAHTCRSE